MKGESQLDHEPRSDETIRLAIPAGCQVEIRAFADRQEVPVGQLHRALASERYLGKHLALHFSRPSSNINAVYFVSISPTGEVRETYGTRRKLSLPT